MVQDADWFAARPGAEHRCRWITSAERMELPTMTGRAIPQQSVIHVAQLEPGIRTRSLYVPGTELMSARTMGLFGHPSTFELLERDNGPRPPTHVGILPSGLQVKMFALPAGTNATEFLPDLDGLIVLRSGDALPVPIA